MTGAVLVETDAVARLEAALAQALEANERLVGLVERQREEIARLREENEFLKKAAAFFAREQR